MGHEDTIPDAKDMRTCAFNVMKARTADDIIRVCSKQIREASSMGNLNTTVIHDFASKLGIDMDYIIRNICPRLMSFGYAVTSRSLTMVTSETMRLTLVLSWAYEEMSLNRNSFYDLPNLVPASVASQLTGGASGPAVIVFGQGDNTVITSLGRGGDDEYGSLGPRGAQGPQGAQGAVGMQGPCMPVGCTGQEKINLRTSA